MQGSVDSPRAFKKFFILFGFCILSGLFVKSWAQRNLDEQWLRFSRSLQQKNIQTSRPQIIFSHYGLPALGALVEDLSFEEKSSTCFQYKITAQHLFLPMSLTSLLLGRFEFGTLQVQKTLLVFNEEHGCTKNSVSDVFVEVENDLHLKKNKESWLEPLQDWFQTHYPRLHRIPIHDFRFQSIEIRGQTLKEKKLEAVGTVSITLRKSLQALFVFDKLLLGKTTRSVETQFTAELEANDQFIHAKGDWGYFEGHLQADLKYTAQQKTELRFWSHNLPLSVLNRWFDTPWTFQFLWFNCDLSLSGEKLDVNALPWRLGACKVGGPYGSIEFTAKENLSLDPLDHLQATIQDLQLDQIFKGKELLPFSGAFKDFGHLDANLSLESRALSGDWKLSHSSLIFSRLSKRLLESIEMLSGRIGYDQGQFFWSLLGAKFSEGEFKGQLQVSSTSLGHWQLHSQVESLSFSSKIQELMLAGKLSPLKIYGDLKWDQKQSLWDGNLDVRAKTYQNSSLQMDGLTFLFGWSQATPQMAMTFEKMNVEPSSSTDWFFASLLAEGEDFRRLQFQQGYVKASVHDKQDIQIEKATAAVPGLGRLNMEAQIDRQSGRGKAVWQLSRKTKVLDWEWSYRSQDSTWLPQTPEMREWLTQHQDFVDRYPFVH